MANTVHLSGLLRVEEIRRISNLGTVMEVTIFEEARKPNARQHGYSVFLTGQQIELVIENNHTDGKNLPFVVISGRLFQLGEGSGRCNGKCSVVLGQYIQFTGAYGVPNEAD